MIHSLRYLSNDPQNTFINIPEDEFMNYIVMSWWYEPLQLVSRSIEHVEKHKNIYNCQVMTCNDPFFEISL